MLVALSGGSDSVALTFLLIDLASAAGFAVAGLAHLNHRLRTASGRDEAFCRDLAVRLGLPITVESVDVAGYAASQQLTVEDAARRIRYEFLGRAAAAAGAARVAVGHTQDDQAETVLLKLIRGAGSTGLGSIYPRHGLVVRPLLDTSRADLRHFLTCRGEHWVEDDTNADLGNPRNRLRHVVLPELEQTYGGAVRGALARAAELMRDDGEYLDGLADALFATISHRTGSGIELDISGLSTEPLPIVRRLLLRALKEVAGGREAGFVHVQSALEVFYGSAGGTDVPGGRVERRGGTLVFTSQPRARP